MWGISLQPRGELPMSRQLFLAIKERVLRGEISGGEPLPSTRDVARQLGVSRNTVMEGYEMLAAEGYAVSSQGAATRIAHGLVLGTMGSAAGSNFDKEVSATPILADFKTGQPDVAPFPWSAWTLLLKEASESLSENQLGYSGAKGSEELCREISSWMLRSRGLQIDPDHIFITAGTTQSLHLLADLLHEEGRSFLLENPSHPFISTILKDKGYPYGWVNVDDYGANILEANVGKVSAVYLTPSHQFPLGSVLPAARRAALIRKAESHGFYIIEDDYDSEFRYGGPAISPIHSMGPSRCIYAGTFSKSLFPALRIGFIVLPEKLHGEWKRRKTFADIQNPILEQTALAAFLRSRRMDKHLRRMRRVYGEKRELLMKALIDVFGSGIRFKGDASGLHLVLEVDGLSCGADFGAEALAAGIRVYPLADYAMDEEVRERNRNKLLLGYGHLERSRIQESVARLHAFLNQRGDA